MSCRPFGTFLFLPAGAGVTSGGETLFIYSLRGAGTSLQVKLPFTDGQRALGAPGKTGGGFQGEGEQRRRQGDRGHARATQGVIG